MTKAPARQPDDLRRIGAFLDARAAETGAARNTLLAYGRDLADLAAFAAARGTPLAALSREQIEDYLARCEAEGLSAATRARRLSAIRQLRPRLKQQQGEALRRTPSEHHHHPS